MEITTADGSWFAVWKREGDDDGEPFLTRIVAWLLLDASTHTVVGLYADEYGVTVIMTPNPMFRGYVCGGDLCPLSSDGNARKEWRWREYYERQQRRRLEYDRKRILGES